jgi:transcriptional regulator with XRE-family HTH domain
LVPAQLCRSIWKPFEKTDQVKRTKELSQGDIEKRTGLLRCYISGVENGHTVPAIEMLEKMARALEVPVYKLFHDGEAAPAIRKLNRRTATHGATRGAMLITSRSCRDYWRKWILTIKSYYCMWRRKPGGVVVQPCLFRVRRNVYFLSSSTVRGGSFQVIGTVPSGTSSGPPSWEASCK